MRTDRWTIRPHGRFEVALHDETGSVVSKVEAGNRVRLESLKAAVAWCDVRWGERVFERFFFEAGQRMAKRGEA